MRRFLTPAMVRQLTKLWMPLGKRVVIIGGDLVGCELAEFLAERGKTVTVLESGKSMAPEMAIPLKWRLMDQLRQMGVAMLTRVKYEEITPDGVVITDKEGKRQTIAADTVILAAGVKPNLEGAKKLGTLAAQKAKEKNIMAVVFDRGGFRYHGRVKALADAAREAGLKF